MISIAFEGKRQISVFRLVAPQLLTIRVVTRRRSQVSICAQLAIAVIGLERTLRSIHRNVIEVDTEAVSLALQKFVRWNFGSLSASTSAFTLPNVVSGLCLMPS